MDEKELLKQAFEYGNVPSIITYCFTEPCPMKDKCIHYLSALYDKDKKEMREYLGSKGQYYRYKLGKLKLLPEQQEYIKQLFVSYGYHDVEFEHFSDEIDFTKS